MRAFRLSNFKTMCTDNNFPNDSHILGDAAYRLTKYIMVPFKDNGHLSEHQLIFNKRLSSARMMVERSIALLKGRFRSILDTLPLYKAKLIPKYIIACCILHNICLLHDDIIDIPVLVNERNCALITKIHKEKGLIREMQLCICYHKMLFNYICYINVYITTCITKSIIII